MSRVRLVAVSALLLGGLAVPTAPALSPAPARLQVVAHEYSYTLSRLHIKSGEAVIELDNFGEDSHDLRLQRVGATHVAALGKVAPGSLADLTLHLAPGRYSLWCSVADHRSLGMRATLVVTR
jgi:plastocyanin